MSRRGERVVNGRVLILVDTFPGVHARETAYHVAEERRAKGQFVRIVKRRTYLYAVYALTLALSLVLLAGSAGCGGQLLREGSGRSELPTSDVDDAGAPDVALTTALSDAALPACVWVHPAESFACAAGAREILADGGGFCACEPGTACEALEVGPRQDSGGEGSQVVGCAFRPGSAP